MAFYATLEQLRRRLPSAGTSSVVDTQLNEILEGASRAIDHYVQVSDDFFTPGGDGTKTVFGSGSSFLKIPIPVYGSVTITAPAGKTVPNFFVGEKIIFTLDESGFKTPYIVWEAGVPYDITGTWGFSDTPADIREACLQLSVRWWRGKDDAFSGVIGGINKDNSIIERSLPAPVRTILDNWRGKTRKYIFA